MFKCTAQEALRNAPFLYKVWTYYSDAKSRDRFISATLSSAARTLGRAEGHVVGLRVAWSWFGQSTNLLIASWGSESPSSSTANIHESRVSWKKKKENKPSRSASRTQTPFYPSSACFLTLWKTSFISVREWLPIDNYALPNLYISLSLSVWLLQPVCLFYRTFSMDPKKKLKKYSRCFTRSARM